MSAITYGQIHVRVEDCAYYKLKFFNLYVIKDV